MSCPGGTVRTSLSQWTLLALTCVLGCSQAPTPDEGPPPKATPARIAAVGDGGGGALSR